MWIQYFLNISQAERTACKYFSLPESWYPYVGIIGQRLKKGPKDWSDVSAQVATDYQRHCENQFVEKLREKYKVEVDKEVLKSVKKHW